MEICKCLGDPQRGREKERNSQWRKAINIQSYCCSRCVCWCQQQCVYPSQTYFLACQSQFIAHIDYEGRHYYINRRPRKVRALNNLWLPGGNTDILSAYNINIGSLLANSFLFRHRADIEKHFNNTGFESIQCETSILKLAILST